MKQTPLRKKKRKRKTAGQDDRRLDVAGGVAVLGLYSA